MEVTKQTLIGDILDFDVETAQFFFEIGMHCLGCPSASGESIEMACQVHGADADKLIEDINNYLDFRVPTIGTSACNNKFCITKIQF